MPHPFRPRTITPHTTSDEVSICFTMPNGRYFNHVFSGLEVIAAGGMSVIEEWATVVDEGIRHGPLRRIGHAETDDEASERLATYSQETRARLPHQRPYTPSASLMQTWQQDIRESMSQRNAFLDVVERRITASEVALRESVNHVIFRQFTVPVVITGLEDPTVPTPTTPPDVSPNEGAGVMPEPTHYLGLPVLRTTNVRVNTVTIQPAPSGRLRYIYVHPTTPTDVWQAEVRRQIARIAQRSAPVSIKQNCRYCGKAYPASQGTSTPDAYCSDRCRHAAADLFDCPVCGGTGRSPSGEGKCGECFGSTYRPCDGCQEDHGRASLMFTNPRTGTVYYVCPSCVDDERNAGGVQAPQASV